MAFSMNMELSLSGALLLAAIALSSCGGISTIPSESWKLPNKENTKSAMIVGRLGLEGNLPLPMRAVTYQEWGKVYFYSGHVPRGEEEFIMDNGYFVIPNIKPGKYRFAGFFAYDAYNSMPSDEHGLFDVKPGEIQFVGSFDYVPHDSTSIFSSATFNLKKAKKPSELEIMRWLLRTSKGSGWESSIKQRIKMLEDKKG